MRTVVALVLGGVVLTEARGVKDGEEDERAETFGLHDLLIGDEVKGGVRADIDDMEGDEEAERGFGKTGLPSVLTMRIMLSVV